MSKVLVSNNIEERLISVRKEISDNKKTETVYTLNKGCLMGFDFVNGKCIITRLINSLDTLKVLNSISKPKYIKEKSYED